MNAAQLILSPRYQLREHGRISGASFNVARSIIPGLTIALFALCHYIHYIPIFIIGTNYKTLDGTCVYARLMQGSISVYRLNSFRHILEESNVYELNGFDVAKCNPAYKFDETPVSIRRRAYCFVGIQVRIPKECFRFRKYDQPMSLANSNTYFTATSVNDCLGLQISLEKAAASQRNLMHFYFDNDGGVSSNYLKKSSTPRVCPIQPDSDIGEELAKEKGRNPMKSPKD
ncbi:LOW QUALITY PROTEIN: hypothetical protein HID58_072258 [Brassica napus]|uniref:Uncharacterized protein n=1 Tax=Brassica napus TaxID=3708 RepID=A0ABQ7Z423_BRANA|nr:LOW QUALITY PROTEIN: hypothetical protein HID58_072258 [Brassica napus]